MKHERIYLKIQDKRRGRGEGNAHILNAIRSFSILESGINLMKVTIEGGCLGRRSKDSETGVQVLRFFLKRLDMRSNEQL